MVVINSCKVLQRLLDGDKIVCTVKVQNKDLTNSDIDTLLNQIDRKFSDEVDSLYYTVRTSINGVKNNYKCKTLDELHNLLKTRII